MRITSLLFLIVLTGCVTGRVNDTPYGLLAQFKQAYGKGDLATLRRLHHPAAHDEKALERIMQEFRMLITEDYRMKSAYLRARKNPNRPGAWGSPPPGIEITYHGGNVVHHAIRVEYVRPSGEFHSTHRAVGVVNDQWYFVPWRHERAIPPRTNTTTIGSN